MIFTTEFVGSDKRRSTVMAVEQLLLLNGSSEESTCRKHKYFAAKIKCMASNLCPKKERTIRSEKCCRLQVW